MIAIILVNWNGCGDTIECLESLLRLDEENFAVIVIDNGSTDGSLAAFTAWAAGPAPNVAQQGAPWDRLPADRRRRPKIVTLAAEDCLADVFPGDIAIVAAGSNLGFAAANNIGMRLARNDSRINNLWLLNNDTVVAPDCATELRRTLATRPDAAIVGACLMYYHAPDIVQGVGGYFVPWLARGGHIGFLKSRESLPPISDVERRMTYVMGASMFLPVSVYDDIGPMSEDYFLYFEEADWSHRLRRSQIQTVALAAIVYHKEGGSIGTNSLKRPSDTSLYYLNRNLIRFMWRWHRRWVPIALVRIVRESLRYLPHGDWRAGRILLRAAVDGCFQRKP